MNGCAEIQLTKWKDGLRLKHKNEFLWEKLEKVDAVSDFIFQFSFKVAFLSSKCNRVLQENVILGEIKGIEGTKYKNDNYLALQWVGILLLHNLRLFS